MKNVVYNECATPWFVYVETFIPAFLKFLVLVNVPFWDDIIRSIAEAKVSGLRRNHMRSLQHRLQAWAYDDPREAKHFYQRGLKTLLVITAPLETIGFFWMLYALTDQFYLDWQTGIMFNSPCFNIPDHGPFQRSRPGGSNIPCVPGGGATPLPNLDQNRASWANNGFSVSLPAGVYKLLWAVDIQAPNGGLPFVQPQIRVTNSLSSPVIVGEQLTLGDNEQTSLVMAANCVILPGGGSAGWEVAGSAVPTGIFCNGGHFIAYREQ